MVERPMVLFLFEVGGTKALWEPLERWLAARKYHAVFQPGSGGSGGVVAACDRGQAKLNEKKCLDLRVLGIKVRCAADGRVRKFAGMHGFNKETAASDLDDDGEPRRACFARQLARATEWMEDIGGLLVGDFNRVMCKRWRASSHRLTDDDKRVRRAAGWACACCDGGAACGAGVVAGAAGPMTTVQKAWLSPNFDRLRKAHRDRTWDDKTKGEPICQSCAVTKKPTPIQVPKDGRVHLRVLTT